MNFKLNLLLLIIASLAALTNGKKDDPCDIKVLDNCQNKLLMLGEDSFVFPTNMEKVNKRCKEVKPLEQCIKNYSTRCLKGESKNAISIVVYGVSKTNKAYCSSVARKKALMSIGECSNTNRKRMDKFMEELNRDFQGAKTYKDTKLRIPLSCCNFYKFKNKLISHLSSRCVEPVVQEIENLVDGYARDGLNLLCGEYTEDSDKCERIVSKTPKWSKPLPHKSFMIPLVEILTND